MECSVHTRRAYFRSFPHTRRRRPPPATRARRYQRSWPLATGGVITQHGYANPTAPVYVINGAAGNREGNEKPDPIAWSAFETDAYGYGMLTIAGPSLLSFQFVRSSDGAVLDSWNITRG